MNRNKVYPIFLCTFLPFKVFHIYIYIIFYSLLIFFFRIWKLYIVYLEILLNKKVICYFELKYPLMPLSLAITDIL